MDEPKPTNPPHFSTLTEIMDHFATVPYEQFQAELQAWFEAGLRAQGRIPGDIVLPGIPDLTQLISRIYHEAEVQQTLSDHHITPRHDED